MERQLTRGLGVTGVAVLMTAGLTWLGSNATAQVSIDIDDNDIGGAVRGAD